MDRLTVVDEIFLRTHRGMGTPIALQGLWRITDAMEPTLLQAIHEQLRVGALGRRVIRPRVPGARRAWQPNTRAHSLDIAADPLPERGILPWADALGTDLDPEFAPGWRLSATPLHDGGTVVALTCSHALADARGLIHAVSAALAELRPLDADPTSSDAPDAPHSRIEYGCRTKTSDWSDAISQWTTIITGTARALRQGIPRPPATTTPAPTADRLVHSTLLTFDAATWDHTAATAGGTANSLFIHLVAKVLWETGFPGERIAASLPVDTRDEPRVDNDLAVTEITVSRADTPATIREKARAAYQRRMSSPAGLPEEILQVVPDRWAYALSKGAGERDILCSNIGTLPDSLRTVGTHHCDRVAARAIHPGITTFPRTRLSGYLSRLGDTYTLALVSLAGEPEAFSAATDRACKALGVRPTPW
ncbi:hypothetical protein [Nocardia mangyaensis]|uniref:hypothetical protein n=1 Tax=Nocardia mangyaensis TaxID=2213200 RepID=UPI00267719B3|nr:hypothetical protein [Nocardia mangyaensis]MDO3649749.1 hypothetical protein [Nocardia mangyaensis]